MKRQNSDYSVIAARFRYYLQWLNVRVTARKMRYAQSALPDPADKFRPVAFRKKLVNELTREIVSNLRKKHLAP